MQGFAGSAYRGVAPYVDIKVGSDDNNWIDPAIQSLYPNFPTEEPEWWKKLSNNLSPAHAGFYFTNKQNQTPTGGLLSFAAAPFVERYCISILFPALGAIPNVEPSPKDSSKNPFGDSFNI